MKKKPFRVEDMPIVKLRPPRLSTSRLNNLAYKYADKRCDCKVHQHCVAQVMLTAFIDGYRAAEKKLLRIRR